MMNIQIPVGISVRYLLENVHTVSGRRTPLSGWSPNIMLDVATGMNIMANRSDWINFVQVGTSSVAPDSSQTSLQAWVAGIDRLVPFTTILNTQSNPGPYYGSRQDTLRFNPGEIPTNDPLNEVGMGYGDGSGGATDIVSRARIVDINGDFTSPTPDPTEFLDVTREVRYVPPIGDITGQITLNGTPYFYILRASNVTDTDAWASRIGQAIGVVSGQANWMAYSEDIGAVDSEPSGLTAQSDNNDQFNFAYVNLSKTIGMGGACGPGDDTPGLDWFLTGGIRSLRITTTAGNYQIQLGEGAAATGTKVPKSSANSMFTKYFLSWDNGPVV
jgi:hypothetical protein